MHGCRERDARERQRRSELERGAFPWLERDVVDQRRDPRRERAHLTAVEKARTDDASVEETDVAQD